MNLKRFVRTLHLALCSRAHRRGLKFDKPEIAALDIARRFAAGPICESLRSLPRSVRDDSGLERRS